jgi:hypothetical protein
MVAVGRPIAGTAQLTVTPAAVNRQPVPTVKQFHL